MRHNGIDVSEVQGNIDWEKVEASGIAFAYIKASEGNYSDHKFASNVMQTCVVGVVTGAYHFLTEGSSVDVQVDTFLKQTEGKDLLLPPVVDFETPDPAKWKVHGGADHIANCLSFCEKLEAATGKKPMIYSYPWFLESLKDADALASYPLWLAAYHDEQHAPKETDAPKVIAPWTDWQCWQWSGDKGLHVPGIVNVVDHDVWQGDLPSP